MWQELTKKGYEIQNKRILGNPLYTSKEARHKDLVQELALVQDWIKNTYNIYVAINPSSRGNTWWFIIYLYDNDDEYGWTSELVLTKYDSSQKALIAGIEYTLNSLI